MTKPETSPVTCPSCGAKHKWRYLGIQVWEEFKKAFDYWECTACGSSKLFERTYKRGMRSTV